MIHYYSQMHIQYILYSTKIKYSYAIKFLISLILLLIIAVYYYIRKLKYILAYKISLDEPNLSAKEILEKSKTLMIGHRKEYFILQLSFIGWRLLAYLTLGIGYIWLIPYIQISLMCFYDKLRENENR